MKNKTKKTLTIGFILLVALITLAYAVFSDGIESFAAVFKAARYRYLFPAAGCMALYWIFEAGAMFVLARLIMPKYRFKHAMQTTMIGQLFNSITPFSSGGQPVQIMTMRKHGVEVGAATAVQLGRFILYQTSLTVVSVVALFLRFRYFHYWVPRFSNLIFIGFAVNLGVMIALFSLGFFPKFTIKTCVWAIKLLHKLHLVKDLDATLKKIDMQVSQFFEGFSLLRSHPKAIFSTLLLSFLQLCSFFSVPYFVCLSLGASPEAYLSMFCAASFVLMISSFVPLPGASGGSEGSFIMFFKLFFVSGSTTGMAVLIWRLFTFYLPILAGSMFTRVKDYRKNKSTERPCL